MKNGQIKFSLCSHPNPDEYEYNVIVKSYTGKLWESWNTWVGYGQNAKDAKKQIIEMMQNGDSVKQAIDNVLSDNPGTDFLGNPIFCEARKYFIEKYDPVNIHPLFSGILANFGLK